MSVRIFCLSRAASPITHAAGTEGNESIVARETVCHNGVMRRVPFLSGNSLRSCCVRQPGMRWLIERYGLSGKLTIPQLNFLLHGGALTESTGRENVGRIAEMQAAWPLLKVLGGCLPDQIIAGSLLGCPGVLVCEENRARIASLLPGGFGFPSEPLLSAESFVRGYQYVTFDAQERSPELLPAPSSPSDKEKERGSTDVRMMFTGQAVVPGALFVHDFILRWPQVEDIGAVLWSLSLWQEGGGIAGGSGARGHGRLKLSVHFDGDAQAAMTAYLAAVDERKDRALAWLTTAFAAKPKPKRAGKPKAEPVGAAEED